MEAHNGHRSRMKTRFLRQGSDSLDDHHLLEMLLYFALPRADTNLLAHDLLDRFGSVDGVLDAAPDELMAVPGVGQHAAVLLKLVPALGRRYLSAKNSIGSILATTEDAGQFLMPRFVGRRDETVLLVCLDGKMKAVSCRLVASGDVAAAHISVRKVVEMALAQNAPFVLLAHNHVNGLALPSREDVKTTLHLEAALAVVGIVLLDHIIVAGNDFVSLKENGVVNRDEEDKKKDKEGKTDTPDASPETPADTAAAPEPDE